MWAKRATVHSLTWALLASCVAAFIVPEELVSFLSIVYSNIPPIRKGTDSRVGVGFRLGPHADAQIVLELGPQTNTRPLGAAAPTFGSPSSSKRHVLPEHLDDDVPQLVQQQLRPNPAAGSWLSAWRTSVKSQRPVPDEDFANQADLSAPGPLPDPTRLTGAPLVSHLRKLYHPPPARQPEAQPERPQERQPARQTVTIWQKAVAAKPYKHSKVSATTPKTVGKPAASASATYEDLSDVSLD
ncbi:uncharacterized protein LOC113209345 [Frankliniella occidentalis]|uniref:Uncharacterized protein LOC113209345 n=1 Tax=Frankliniella occidentalis TaxID=133901 RepID=A0A9C6U1P6_FRAOC|nr:uncharacterized protein LOC113209345 [Frankliniella occidentalis]XP_052121435.1 uncharacterized protein LOC113209345 [Frankliniella occidentalis]